MRCAYRNDNHPDNFNDNRGFRVVAHGFLVNLRDSLPAFCAGYGLRSKVEGRCSRFLAEPDVLLMRASGRAHRERACSLPISGLRLGWNRPTRIFFSNQSSRHHVSLHHIPLPPPASFLLFLSRHNSLTLATVGPDGAPHAAAVFYAAGPDGVLYYLSDPKTVHARHIKDGARAAATIEENNQDWKSIRGVQIHGWAGPCAEPDEEEIARAVHAARFPFVARAETLAGPLSRARYYKLIPTWMRLIDNTLGFGHKEEWGGDGETGRPGNRETGKRVDK